MSSVVAVLDRDGWQARTDNLVIAEPQNRRLLWVPRDLWSRQLGDRINQAFARGGAALLRQALAEHGLCVDGVLCLQRHATERVLATLRVRVPVGGRTELLDPLHPLQPIKAGCKVVVFGPGEEWLEGERIHAWLGARYTRDGPQSDLARFERQKAFVRRLLEDGADFRAFLRNPVEVQVSAPEVLEELAQVRPDWVFDTFGPLDDAIRGGAMVLVPRSRFAAVRLARRVRFGVRRRRLAARRRPA